MKIPRDIDSGKLIKAISQYGYKVSRQTGSHIRVTNQDGSHSITIPHHSPIKVGTLNSIVKDFCTVNKINAFDFYKML